MSQQTMKLDAQAVRLNETIRNCNPAVAEMLSTRGEGIYFPKLGILSQSAEAAGKGLNATIGTALNEEGGPMSLDTITSQFNLPPKDVLSYAPSPGRPDIRKKWKEMLAQKNPGLAGKSFSTPIVTSALTHGLSICGYLFCNPGDRVIVPDLYWENYDLIFSNAYGALIDTFETFTADGAFNLDALERKLNQGPAGKRILLLNFPNNPAGYTMLQSEEVKLAAILKKSAEAGNKIVVMVDDAYFGLVFEEGVATESFFCQVCDLHPNLLAVKLDGPTKEDYVWGFRVGFITYGIQGGGADLYEALEAKTGGAIRGNISNSSMPAQSALLKAWQNPKYAVEKQQSYDLLKKRYDIIKKILADHPEYASQFRALPFNSGYFMCVKLVKHDPETVRQKLLKDYDTGLIAISGVLRIAFSSVPSGKLALLFDNLYRACCDLDQ